MTKGEIDTYGGGRLKRRDVRPTDYSFDTLCEVGDWFEEHLERLGQGRDWFWGAVSEWTDTPADPDYWLHQISLPNQGNMFMPNHVSAIIACCVASRIEECYGEERIAWTYAADARQLASKMMHGYSAKWRSLKRLSKRGSDVRHSENRAMKQEALDAYLRGGFTSKDAAAEYIAGRVVPVKFRTVRDWLKGI